MCPDDGSRPAGWRATLDLAFERRDTRTVLARRRHEGPLVVQKPLYPEGDAICHAIVVHPPAGIAGGDDLQLSIAAGEGARALITTPGAAKWYRSNGAWARQRTVIDVAAGAWLEWLPQETILYDASRADIGWCARLAGDARLIAWDIACLGRTASGEGYERAQSRIESRVSRDGRLLFVERAHLQANDAVLASPAGLASSPVFGTLIASAPDLAPKLVEACREERPAAGQGAVTMLPGVLIARYRGASTEAARNYFTALWRRLRKPLLGADAAEPRIWRT
jgi:urease accessory protein